MVLAVATAQVLPSQLPGTAQADLETVSDLLLHRRYAEAETLAREVVRRDDTNPAAHTMLAYALFREDKPADSLREYTRAAALRTPSAQDLKWVAEDYVLLHDYADAERWMQRSVETNPGDEQAWYALGRIQYTLNLFAKAQTSFAQALKIDPRDEKAENNLGLAYEGLYMMKEAVEAYQTAIEWQKESSRPDEQPFLNLGTVMLHQNKLPEADALLRRAATLSPHDPKILTALASLNTVEGKLPVAEENLRSALSERPDDAAIHFQLGRVLHKEGKEQDAKVEFDRAASLNGTHSSPER